MRRALAVVILVGLSQVPIPAGRAQQPDSIVLELVHQPVWHRAEDPLGLELRIRNDTDAELDGFRLRVGVYDRVQSRSELHESFDAAPFLEPSSFPADFNVVVAPGEEAAVAITEPASALATLAAAQEGGVFPLTIALQARDATVLATITTSLLYFPGGVERPLNFVMLVPLNDVPARAPDGTFEANEDGWPLEVATQESGWLRGVVEALLVATNPPPAPPSPPNDRRSRRQQRRDAPRRPREVETPPPRLRFAFAPVPRLLEELSDMSDGYRRSTSGETVELDRSSPPSQAASQVIEGLRALAERDGVQSVLVPYAFPDLPSLTLEELAAQLDSAESSIQRVLGEASGFSRRWVFPPAGRLDASTLEALRSLQAAESTFSSEAAFLQDVPVTPGCPEPFASFTCPVQMETSDSASKGFVSDAKLQDLFGDVARAEPSATVELQRFWSDTVQVWAELPGTRDRTLYFALPTTWRPSPEIAERFFSELARAPWLKTVTPDEALARAAARPRPMIDFEETPASPLAADELAEAAERVASLEALIPTADRASAQRQLLQRLHSNLLTAHSRVWFDQELIAKGLGYATETTAEADRHFANVDIGGADEIALTSRRAPIQLLLLNQNSHPVAVEVHLESEGLDLQEEVIEEVVPAERTRQIQIEAQTRASGIFPLRVSVQTSDGYEIAQTSIRIRSTEFNEVALGVTIGALVFLIAFFVIRTVRSKSQAPAEAEGA
ncbi:MAG: DUF6049 family protein [Actinomycetota bacterium]